MILLNNKFNEFENIYKTKIKAQDDSGWILELLNHKLIEMEQDIHSKLEGLIDEKIEANNKFAEVTKESTQMSDLQKAK